MSFKRTGIFPPNPVTARGTPTKLSATKDKVVYATGKTVIVRFPRDLETHKADFYMCLDPRFGCEFAELRLDRCLNVNANDLEPFAFDYVLWSCP